jgi:uncharacterized protein YcgI (DUF1989 family)
MTERLAPSTGTAFTLTKGQSLTVIDPTGEQVCDMLAYAREDVGEHLSSGRSIDYAGKIFFSVGDALYSNRSRVMLRIIEDTVGRHDFLLTPCSAEMFRIIYADANPHHGCQGNFEGALAPFGIGPDQIPTAFNIFMYVDVDAATGQISVRPPLSRAGDRIKFEAELDLIVALTACSAPQSNNGSFKPIDYEIG